MRCLFVLLFTLTAVHAQFGEFAEMLVEFGTEMADSIMNKALNSAFSQDSAIKAALQQIQHELDEIRQKLDEIEHELSIIDHDIQEVKITTELASLEQAHAFIYQEADFMINQAPHIVDANILKEKAHNYAFGTGSNSMTTSRQALYNALTGEALEGDKSIIAAEFEATGLLPVHLMQKLGRSLGMAQALISWGYMTAGEIPARQSDLDEWKGKYKAIWDKNHGMFDIGSCKWGKDDNGADLALLCDQSERPARTILNGTVPQGHTDCAPSGDNMISIPTKGSDHDEWGFDLECSDHVVGLDGSSRVPHGHDKGYVAGFKLKCADGSETDRSVNYKTDGASKYFSFAQQAPLVKLDGCTNVPHGHHTSYWALGTFTDTASQTVDLPSIGDGCGGNDGVHFHISCDHGYCMKRFQGWSNVPKGHDVSYIACLNIQCSLCTDEVQV